MTEQNEKVLERARVYLDGFLDQKGGLGKIKKPDLVMLIHNSLLAGWDDNPLDWNDEDPSEEDYKVPVGSLHWQDEFRKVGGSKVYTVVSEYSATKTLGLREGHVWVTDGANVNLMEADKLVVHLPFEE